MFSIKTRRRIVVGLIVIVYAGMLGFFPFVLSPQMQSNAKDQTDLKDGATKLVAWKTAAEDGSFEQTESRVLAEKNLSDQSVNAYAELKSYYRRDPDILDRPNLLNDARPDLFKLDYISLAENWNALARRKYGRHGEESISIAPSYAWVTEPEKLPQKGDLAQITKTTCLIDTVVRLLATGRNGGFAINAISVGKPSTPDPKLSAERAKTLKPPRYTITPVTVVCEVPYSTYYRSSLERIISSPEQSAVAPKKVQRNPTTGAYLPSAEETYKLPPVRIRSLSFQPVAINSATVTMVLDVYDFEWKEDK